ncbi:TLC domain-containing protein 2 [Platysternon megacephalum]|uniref:TLC domain-containing protein 2 n=1 Tax=Platysternon megacephalum TaxID=55544 RepID=A0A4D9E442_9SAUR|nr:TLC domain-containing protein 2 [Platysternon megacephalum]
MQHSPLQQDNGRRRNLKTTQICSCFSFISSMKQCPHHQFMNRYLINKIIIISLQERIDLCLEIRILCLNQLSLLLTLFLAQSNNSQTISHPNIIKIFFLYKLHSFCSMKSHQAYKAVSIL